MYLLSLCDNPDILSVFSLVNIVISIIKIAVPIILIFSVTLKLMNAVKDGDDSALKKAQMSAISSGIACVLVFFIPLFVNVVLGIASADKEYEACLQGATSSNIQNLYKTKAESILKKAEEEEDVNLLSSAIMEIYKINDSSIKNNLLQKAKVVEDTINLKAKEEYEKGTGRGGYGDGGSGPYFDGTFQWPCNGPITSKFGPRKAPTASASTNHRGIDIGVSYVSVYASAPGIVTSVYKVPNPSVANSSCGGNYIIIKHEIDGKEYQTVYRHMSKINVSVNTVVTTSTVIGISGGGESYDKCTTGPHLHFEIIYQGTHVNPEKYLPTK